MALQTETPAPAPIRVDVTLDEIETSLNDQKAADETKKKADEAAVIEEARVRAAAAAGGGAPSGESVQVRALQEALRISEEARRDHRVERPAETPPEPKKTKEELAALMQSDPIAAIAYMQGESMKIVTENFERRFGSLMKGSESTAESLARQKYPTEFEMFGTQINEFIATLPEANRASLGTTAGWDDLISWFRGRPGNFEKLSAKLVEKQTNAAAIAAQAAQAAGAGATIRSEVRSPQASGGGQLDATEKEIAKTLGLTDAEYITWRKVAP